MKFWDDNLIENINLLCSAFAPNTWATWFGAIGTFLAVCVALKNKTGLSMYITSNDYHDHFNLHVINPYNTENSFKIIKVYTITNAKYNHTHTGYIKIPKHYVSDYNAMGRLKYYYNVSSEVCMPLENVNDYLNDDGFEITNNHKFFKESFFVIKDSHHHHYILIYPDNKMKKYHWYTFPFVKIHYSITRFIDKYHSHFIKSCK